MQWKRDALEEESVRRKEESVREGKRGGVMSAGSGYNYCQTSPINLPD